MGNKNGVWVKSGNWKLKKISNQNKMGALFESIILCTMNLRDCLTFTQEVMSSHQKIITGCAQWLMPVISALLEAEPGG